MIHLLLIKGNLIGATQTYLPEIGDTLRLLINTKRTGTNNFLHSIVVVTLTTHAGEKDDETSLVNLLTLHRREPISLIKENKDEVKGVAGTIILLTTTLTVAEGHSTSAQDINNLGVTNSNTNNPPISQETLLREDL